jgi:hypothetical protein
MKRIKRSGYWYLLMPEHPRSGKQGYVAEHRVVVESVIGRFLEKGEVVHHKDHNKENNEPDNLELFSSPGQHTIKEHPEVLHILRTVNIGIRRSPKTEFKKGIKSWNSGKVISDAAVICKVDQCDRSAWYKNEGRQGYCSMHWQRKRKGKLS